MNSENYWNAAAHQVRAEPSEAAGELTRDLGQYLNVIVKRALRHGPTTSGVARTVHAVAQQVGVRPDASIASVEHVAHLLARTMTARLQACG
jgi:hypothetical protein